jgi:arylsulfatase A-like enzyme
MRGVLGAAVACLSLVAACNGVTRSTDAPPSRPNVVLIVVDTLRADHVGAYGGAVATPAMDALAARGVRFDAAYAHAPMTAPSHASMFTGQMPREHGVLNNGQPFDPPGATLAEVLHDRGYRTAAFVSLEVMSKRFGWGRGFDVYEEDFGRGWWRTAEDVNADVLPWLRSRARSPFFLFVHYSDPHEPYLPPARAPAFEVRRGGGGAGVAVAQGRADGLWTDVAVHLQAGDNVLEVTREVRSPWPLRITSVDVPEGVAVHFGEGFEEDRIPAGVGRGILHFTAARPSITALPIRLAARPELPPEDQRRHYAEEVHQVDAAIGAVLEALEQGGRMEDTLVLLTSDHGEMLGERAGERFGHVHDLYEELIRVPWVMALPGRLPAGHVEPGPVRHVDLAPTIAHFVQGAALPDASGGPAWPPYGREERPVVAETHPPQAEAHRWAVRLGDRKVIHDTQAPSTHVYDLRLSPDERRTLDDLAAEVVEAAGGMGDAPPVHDLSDQDRDALRALGYVE